MRLAGLLVTGLLPCACVLGTERSPSRLELARAPAEPVLTPNAATGTRTGCTEAADDPGRPPRAGSTWIDGYCHYDGIRYRWEPGHWEAPTRTVEGR